MRTGILKKAKDFFVLSGVCLFFVPFSSFFSACGIEEYIYIQAPTVLNHSAPTYETEFADRYVAFSTEERQANEGSFLGTAVYYKIYNNYGTMQNRVSEIESLSNSTNESAAASRMIDTHGYKPLGLDENYSSPLIEKTGQNRKVYIRLTNYYENQSRANMAMVIIGNENVDKFMQDSSDLYDSSSNPNGYRIHGIPRRAGNRYTFDFGRNIPSTYENAENNVPPETEQNLGDYEASSGFSNSYEDCYFIDLFAVGVGEDENFTQYYSNVLHLGSVAVDSKTEHN